MLKIRLVSVAAALGFVLAAAAPAQASQPYPVNFHNFPLNAPDSTRDGTVLSGGALTLASSGLQVRHYTDTHANYNSDGVDGSGDYAYGTWTSGVYELNFGFNELVSSWNATTPAGTWIQVEVSPRMED